MEAISEEEARRLLEEADVAHIAVVADGEPYVTPMSFALDGNRLFFRTATGRRRDAILAHPAVCVEACKYDPDTGEWESVIANGLAEEMGESELRTRAVELLLRKYQRAIGSPLTFSTIQPLAALPHVVMVTITSITGVCSGRGLAPRSRPGRL